MKTKIILATLLILALPMTAKNKKEQNKFASQKAVLTGIWQQCLPMNNNGNFQVRFMPHFKILSGDGTFCNMSQANSVAPAALFTTGEWRVTSDSTFVEHIATNANSVYEGKDNELTFRLPMGNQVLEVFYTMPGDTRRIREAWIRVQKGNAAAIAQKYFERLNGIKSGGNDTPKNQQNLIIEEPQGSDENLSLTENPRGIYKLMAIKGGRQDIDPYPHDVYKICTDSVTMRMTMLGGPNKMFRIDHSDPEVLNYTGERSEADKTDKSVRIFDSNAERFTLKWWSMLQNSLYYPYNNWGYEYYESGKYSEAAKPIAEVLTSAPARDPNNPLIGTWQYALKMEKIEKTGQDNWIEELKKVDNMKDILAYFRQTEPGEPKQYQVYTPSHFFTMRMLDNMKEMMGAYDNVIYNGKESVTAPGGEVMEIHWLTDDAFAIKQQMGNKVLYRIWERVTDNDSMLSRIGRLFLNGNKPK